MWQVRFHRTSARKQKSPFTVAPFTPHGGSAATVCRTAARSEPTKFPVGAQAPREFRVAPPRISQWSSDLQMKLSIRGSVLGILRSITVACKDPASSAMAAVVRRLFSSVGQLVQALFTIGRRHAGATTANVEDFRRGLGENPVFINGKTGRAKFMREERDGPAHYVISVSPFPADVVNWRTTRRGGNRGLPQNTTSPGAVVFCMKLRRPRKLSQQHSSK